MYKRKNILSVIGFISIGYPKYEQHINYTLQHQTPSTNSHFQTEDRLEHAIKAIAEDDLGALQELLTTESSLIRCVSLRISLLWFSKASFLLRAQDRKGLCLLHHAARKGNAGALAFLLDSGEGDLVSICNTVDHRGLTPVFYSQTAQVVELFLTRCRGILELTQKTTSLRPRTLLDTCKAVGIMSETIERALFHLQAHESAVDAIGKGEFQRLKEIVNAYPKVTG